MLFTLCHDKEKERDEMWPGLIKSIQVNFDREILKTEQKIVSKLDKVVERLDKIEKF